MRKCSHEQRVDLLDSKGWCSGQVDAEDLERIQQYKWRIVIKASGRKTVVTRITQGKARKQLSLGAFLMNPPPGKMVYPRRFNDGLDYRKENLVVCTMQERQLYLPKTRKASSSKYRGVYFLRSKQKWRAGIKVNGKNITIGLLRAKPKPQKPTTAPRESTLEKWVTRTDHHWHPHPSKKRPRSA